MEPQIKAIKKAKEILIGLIEDISNIRLEEIYRKDEDYIITLSFEPFSEDSTAKFVFNIDRIEKSIQLTKDYEFVKLGNPDEI